MLSLDIRDFLRAADQMKAAQDQVPFAISLSLNTAAREVETRLANETWARNTANRNRGFFRAAIDIERSDKRNLRVALFDKLQRGKLFEHSHGGTVRAQGRFAIPTQAVPRTARGVPRGRRPSAIPEDRKVVKGGLIFEARGKGKNRRLQLLYKLQSDVRIKKDVPLVEDFHRFMRAEARRKFPEAMARAMRSRRG